MYFEKLVVNTDLSLCALEEAASLLGPSFMYDLYVHECQLLYTRRLLRSFGAELKDHPFSPYINLHTFCFKRPTTWVLCANERKVGSEGVY